MQKRVYKRGQRFGRLTFVREVEPLTTASGRSHRRLLCKCDCGKTHVALADHLVSGKIRSCGCFKAETTSERLRKPLAVGQRFGRLVVIEQVEPGLYRFKCDCGNTVVKTVGAVRNRNCRSCGCLRPEAARELMVNRHRALGHTKISYHPLTIVLRSMCFRCYNPKCKQYKYYGARGIRVCDEWNWHPEAFIEWALSHGYRKGLTIERIDNDGNYEPGNCTWIPQSEQLKNQRERGTALK